MAFHPLTARPLAMFTLNRIPFHAGTKSYPVECEHYPTCHCHSPLKRSLRAQLRSVTEIAPKSLFLLVNRSPNRYGFRACAKAIP